MKLTKDYLKRLIKEEMDSIKEYGMFGSSTTELYKDAYGWVVERDDEDKSVVEAFNEKEPDVKWFFGDELNLICSEPSETGEIKIPKPVIDVLWKNSKKFYKQ